MKKFLLALTTTVCLGCSPDERAVNTEDNPIVLEYFKERLLDPNKQFAPSNDVSELSSVTPETSTQLKKFDANLVETEIQKDPAFSSFRWITPTVLLVEPSQLFEKSSFEKLCARIPQTHPDVDFAVNVNALPMGIGFVHCVRRSQFSK